MNFHRYFHSVYAVLSLIAHFTFYTSIYAQVAAPAAPGPFPLEITEEDLRKAEEQIEVYRASMSPAEREEFDRQVEELTKILENMPESELEQFFMDLAKMEQEAAAQMPADKPTPIVEPVLPLPEPTPAKPEQPKKGDTRPAEQLIDNIVTRIQSFMLKTKSIQDFDFMVARWIREGSITKIAEITNWQQLEHGIQLFTQKILKLKDKDPKTREQRYLFDLIEDKELYEKLSELNSELTNIEPNIIVSPTPGAQQLSKNSKVFTQKVIDTLTQAIYVDKIGESIDKIIEKYEPTAKKLKEYEERKERQALEASKRPLQPETAKTVGKTPTEPAPYQIPDYGRDFGAAPSGYIPSAPTGISTTGPRFTPEAPAQPATPTPPAPAPTIPTTPGAPSPARAIPGKEIVAPKDGAIKPEAEERPSAPPTEQPAASTREVERNIRTMENLMDKIIKNTEEMVDTLKRDDVKKFKDQLTLENVDLGLAKRMSLFGQNLEKTKDNLNKIESGIKNIPADITKEIKKEIKPIFDSLATHGREFYQQLREVKIEEWPKADTPVKVKYAYFADKTIPAPADLETLKEPANIKQIKKDFDEVIAKLQKLLY